MLFFHHHHLHLFFLLFTGGLLLHGPKDADHHVHRGAAGTHRRLPLAGSAGETKKNQNSFETGTKYSR